MVVHAVVSFDVPQLCNRFANQSNMYPPFFGAHLADMLFFSGRFTDGIQTLQNNIFDCISTICVCQLIVKICTKIQIRKC